MIFLQEAMGFGLLAAGFLWLMVYVALPVLSVFLFMKLKKKEIAVENTKRSFSDNATTALSALLLSIFILAFITLFLLFLAGCFITKID